MDSIDLPGLWYGWRLRGHILISPDGDRMTPERLRGILFSESLRLRYASTPGAHRRAEAVAVVMEFKQGVERLRASRSSSAIAS